MVRYGRMIWAAENHIISVRYADDAESHTSREAITVITGKANKRVFVPQVICEVNTDDHITSVSVVKPYTLLI